MNDFILRPYFTDIIEKEYPELIKAREEYLKELEQSSMEEGEAVNYRIDGDKIYYGQDEWDWVGFYSPIKQIEDARPYGDLYVTTDLGKYILVFRSDGKPDRIEDFSGKSIYDLQREHYPHLYNEDGTWKGTSL